VKGQKDEMVALVRLERRNFTVNQNIFFFERTAQDRACFIDIEDKDTAKEKKEKRKLVRLDWDVNAGSRTTVRTGWLD
jgi:hypothetical protein